LQFEVLVGRTHARTVLDFLRKGDVLMVTRIDPLARSIGDLQDIVRAVKARGASLRATEQPIDTGTAAGKCFLDMLGVFAEFETNLRRERQLEGIAGAKARGVYKGRKASIDPTKIKKLKADGMGRPPSRRRSRSVVRRSIERSPRDRINRRTAVGEAFLFRIPRGREKRRTKHAYSAVAVIQSRSPSKNAAFT
jgi:DNA invertase Pin-like site-specific DNA recombinase